MIMSGSVSSEKCIPIKMHVILYRKVNYYSGGELLQTVGGTSFCSVNASPLSCSPLPNGFKYAFCVCTLKDNRGIIQFCVSFRDICLTGTMFWSRMMMQKKNRSDRLITRISGHHNDIRFCCSRESVRREEESPGLCIGATSSSLPQVASSSSSMSLGWSAAHLSLLIGMAADRPI